MEIIPKEIVDSASKIISETNFRIIKDDPIIEFTVQTKKGVKTTISYNVGEISKENAEKIIELSALQKFIAPPLLFEESDKTEELLASQLGFFSSETILLIGIIGVLLLAIIIIIIIFVSKYSVPKNALHAEKPIIEKPKHEQVPEPNKPATQNEEAPKSNP